jgi:hypothetical protein
MRQGDQLDRVNPEAMSRRAGDISNEDGTHNGSVTNFLPGMDTSSFRPKHGRQLTASWFCIMQIQL